jgi:hypothetical protein
MRRALTRSDDSRRRPLPSDRFDKLVKKSMVFKSEIKGALVLMEKQSIDGLKSLYESTAAAESYFHEFLVLSLAAALHDQAKSAGDDPAAGDPARAAADSAIGKFKASSRPFTSKDWILQLDNLLGWLTRGFGWFAAAVQVATPPFDWAAIQPHVDELLRRCEWCPYV